VKDPARDLYHGLIRVHVLLHAIEEPIFGLEMMEELNHHGYLLEPGTLYALLHGLEKAGLLKSSSERQPRRRRRMCRITAAGRKALTAA